MIHLPTLLYSTCALWMYVDATGRFLDAHPTTVRSATGADFRCELHHPSSLADRQLANHAPRRTAQALLCLPPACTSLSQMGCNPVLGEVRLAAGQPPAQRARRRRHRPFRQLGPHLAPAPSPSIRAAVVRTSLFRDIFRAKPRACGPMDATRRLRAPAVPSPDLRQRIDTVWLHMFRPKQVGRISNK